MLAWVASYACDIGDSRVSKTQDSLINRAKSDTQTCMKMYLKFCSTFQFFL